MPPTTINYTKQEGTFADNIREKNEILQDIIQTIQQDSFGVGKDIIAALENIVLSENLTEEEINEYINNILELNENKHKQHSEDSEKDLQEKDKELKKYLNIIAHLSRLQQDASMKLNAKIFDIISLIISKIIAKLDFLIKSTTNIDIIMAQNLKNINQLLSTNNAVRQNALNANTNEILQSLSRQLAMQNQQLKQSHNQNIVATQALFQQQNVNQNQQQANQQMQIKNEKQQNFQTTNAVANIHSNHANQTQYDLQNNTVDPKAIMLLINSSLSLMLQGVKYIIEVAKVVVEEMQHITSQSTKHDIEINDKNNNQTQHLQNQNNTQMQQNQNNVNIQQANQQLTNEEEEIDFDAEFERYNAALMQTNQKPQENNHKHEQGCPCCSGHDNFVNDEIKIQTQIKDKTQRHQEQEQARDHNLQHQLLFQK